MLPYIRIVCRQVPVYGLCMMLGAALGWALCRLRAARPPSALSPGTVDRCFLWIGGWALVGAKMYSLVLVWHSLVADLPLLAQNPTLFLQKYLYGGMVFYGGLLGALMFGAFQLSIEMSGGATAVVLLYTAPAWVAVLSRVLFHEAISRTKLLAIAIALAGVVLVSLSGGSHSGVFSWAGILCGLASGFGYAAYFPFTFYFVQKYKAQTIYSYAFLGSALVLLPFIFPLDLGKSAEVWGLLGLMSVSTNFLAYIFLALSLKCITQVQSAVVGNIEPVLGTLWVWLFFDENFRAIGWGGCALIMGAVFLLTLEKKCRT